MKLGFVGLGNMASAIIGGIMNQKLLTADQIIGSDLSPEGRERTSRELGIAVTADNKEVVEKAEVIFLAVKPQFYEAVISEIKEKAGDNKVFITIAPGKSLAWIEEQFGKKVKVVRTMPNTPAMVGEGMTVACPNAAITETELSYVKELLGSFGEVEVIPERLMNSVVAVNGSSPAYVFMMIEAMADAAVEGGIPRAQAYKLAAQSVMGSAKMVMETGRHPGELKDMVCSPAGTTIGAVRVLEEYGFRSAIKNAMIECTDIANRL